MPQRVYRFRDLRDAGVSYTRKHVTHLEKQGAFPLHFELGSNSVGWVADEVDAWVDERIRRRGAPRAAPTPRAPVAAQKTNPASSRKKAAPRSARTLERPQGSARPRQEYGASRRPS